MEINRIIRNRRLELGLTLKDVATALNIAESTVSRYESSDIQNMGIDKIESLSKVLRCSPAYLMGWENPTVKSSSAPKIMEFYNKLNDLGKREAAKRVEELTYLPQYANENTGNQLNAAHSDDYANSPDYLKKLEEDIMDDENF